MRKWDGGLSRRGVQLVEYEPQPGETYWKCIEGRYIDEDEARGRHNIFVDCLDEKGERIIGVPVVLVNGGTATKFTEAKPRDDFAADFPMYAAGFGYAVRVMPQSDIITRMGLGTIVQPFVGIHVSYRFVFQRTTAEQDSQPADGLLGELLVLRSMVDDLIQKYGGQK
jgi:hypothetical protein